MRIVLLNLVSAIEWQCAHSAALETWHQNDGQAHTYEFEGPDGESLTLLAWREGNEVTVQKEDGRG